MIAEAPPDEAALKQAIAAAGYTVLAVTSEPYQKRGLVWLRPGRAARRGKIFIAGSGAKPGGR